ncbi:MAG: transposase [Verrucomicrobiia bacterium]
MACSPPWCYWLKCQSRAAWDEVRPPPWQGGPCNRQSGDWNGCRHISGGRSAARKALYMAALVASRHNAELRPIYQRLKEAGKPPKVALVALMRMLINHLNSRLKSSTLSLAS